MYKITWKMDSSRKFKAIYNGYVAAYVEIVKDHTREPDRSEDEEIPLSAIMSFIDASGKPCVMAFDLDMYTPWEKLQDMEQSLQEWGFIGQKELVSHAN